MYQFPYSEICDELPSHEVSQARRLSDAIELIEAVQAATPRSHEWLGVLSDFRKAWVTIVEDLRSGSHDHDVSVSHTRILWLADCVLREIERCRFRQLEALALAWRGRRLQ